MHPRSKYGWDGSERVERQEIISELKKAGFQLERAHERYGDTYAFGHLRYIVGHNPTHRSEGEVRRLVKRAWEMRADGFGIKENIEALEGVRPVITIVDNKHEPEKKPEPKPFVEKPAEPDVKKPFPGMTAEETEELQRRIWDLHANAEMTYTEIANILNTEKVLTPTGRSAWSSHLVGNQLVAYRNMLKARRERKARAQAIQEAVAKRTLNFADLPPQPPQPPQPPPPSIAEVTELPVSVCLILEDATVSGETKLSVLSALGAKLPASASLVFEDTDLTSEQKVAVISALLRKK